MQAPRQGKRPPVCRSVEWQHCTALQCGERPSERWRQAAVRTCILSHHSDGGMRCFSIHFRCAYLAAHSAAVISIPVSE